ncbi:four-carbon acid sugar kinase family protein [Streptomyces sp. NPDC059455]|uniref:four-carbon acid sugar kinase family protein n=1 Tax=Streptomyces sp. NPDC059455 TaxID=3346837 RepID=UPI00367718F4
MTPSRRLLAIADDLSGAAEVAAAVCSRTTRSRVLLFGGPGAAGMATALRPRHVGEATVLDLDSRYRPAAEAAEAVRGALRMSWPDGGGQDALGAQDTLDTSEALDTFVLKKIDSLLRGNVGAEIAALAEDGAGVVLAPALPIAGRVVRSGVVHIGGVPLHEGDAWRAEAVPPPASVAQALGGLPTDLIPLTTVRSSRPTLLTALRAAATAGRVAICDAETDADLNAIVEASLADGPGMRLVGSGGLALAVGRHLATAPHATAAPATGSPATPDPTTAPAAAGGGVATPAPAKAAPAATSPAVPDAELVAAAAAAAPSASAGTATDATTAPTAAIRGTPATTPTGAAAPAAGAATPSARTGPTSDTPTAPAATASRAATPATTPAAGAAGTATPSAGAGRPVLVVVGTAEPAAVEQVRRLVEDGAIHHRLPLAGLLSDGPPVRLPPMTDPVTVVSLAPPGPTPPTTDTAPIPSPRPAHEAVGPDTTAPPAPGPRRATPPTSGGGTDRTGPERAAGAGPGPVSGRRLVLGLARAIGAAVAAHGGAVDLVLTGGETARRVLDALVVNELDPVGQVHHGAVHLRTPDGRSVVTRPGSFGDPDSLRHIVQALRPHPTERKVTS